MAEAEKSAEGAEVKKAGNKKLIIIIALVVLVVVGASVGFTVFLLAGGSEDTATEATAETIAEAPKQAAAYLELKPPLIVTYSHKGKQRFIQASLSVMARSQTVLDAVDLHGPMIRNRLINLYGAKDFEVLQTHEGRIGLLEDTRAAINAILQEHKVGGEVEAVLFQNVVLQ